MLRFWPLFFFIIPLIEIYFLVQVGEQIGAWYTVLLVIITAVIGVSLLRQQGMKTLLKANQAMQAGQMPAQEMFDGLILAVVGVLLVTPGFFTDALGFILLIPLVRKVLMRSLLHKLVGSMSFSQSSAQYRSSGRAETPQQPEDLSHSNTNRTIEGEYKKED
jgi:UPF0716 protein FxsA